MGVREKLRTGATVLLVGTAGVCISLVFWRAFHGEFRHPVGVRSPMNVEGICALSLLSLAFLRSSNAGSPNREQSKERAWPALLTLAALTLFAFGPFLSFPFLADDYEHIWNARHLTVQSAIGHFVQPEEDRFFRPLVYLAYGLESGIAGLSPAIWRLLCLLWHCGATLLVFLLIRALALGTFPAFAGAALFTLHGSRPEAVTWVAAQFDLMATTLGLAALVALLTRRELLALALLLLALLSKESAFVIPPLAALILWYRKEPWPALVRRVWPWFAVAAAMFLYRMSVLGEIGGYHNADNGRPTIYNLRLTTTVKGLFVRSWAAMLVPVNWDHPTGPALGALLAAGMLAFTWLAYRGGNRLLLFTGIAFFYLASLPVHQFLSIGDDLEKSRVLYLPSVGVAIFFAALVARSGSRLSGIAAIVFIAFQFGALEHNLSVWKSVGSLAEKTCNAIAARLARSRQPVSVSDLPNIVDGVYFLKTGYPACVWLQRPGDTNLVSRTPQAGSVNLRWDEKSRTLVSAAP